MSHVRRSKRNKPVQEGEKKDENVRKLSYVICNDLTCDDFSNPYLNKIRGLACSNCIFKYDRVFLGPKRKIDTSSPKYKCVRIRNKKTIKVTVVVNTSNALKKRINSENKNVVFQRPINTTLSNQEWFKHYEEVKNDISLRSEIAKLKNDLFTHELQIK